MWYCKMYFPGRHEVIESDAFGTQGAPSQRKAFPFWSRCCPSPNWTSGRLPSRCGASPMTWRASTVSA